MKILGGCVLTVLLAGAATGAEKTIFNGMDLSGVPSFMENYPSAKKAWKKTGDEDKRMGLIREINALRNVMADSVYAMPAAKDFPGLPETGCPIIEKKISVSPRVGGWHSTGLYALPGEKVEVSFPASVQLKSGNTPRYRVQIGCHTDHLGEKHDWKRVPQITSQWPVTAPEMIVSSPMGGLIYIDVATPDTANRDPGYAFSRLTYIPDDPSMNQAPDFQVDIKGAVAAPYFRLGETSPEEWRKMITAPSAPWGEIAGRRMIVSLPLEQLRMISDPAKLMTYADSGMDVQSWFIAWDVTAPERTKIPMRIVVDRQISAGGGHAGYPAMGHLDWGAPFAKGTFPEKGSWGLWHEMGHNHQTKMYQLAGMTEVTVNLFSLAAQSKVHKVGLENAWDGFKNMDGKLTKFFSDTVIFNHSHDVGLQLYFFADLLRTFGFEPFREMSIEFGKTPYPKSFSNVDKWSWIMKTLSQKTGKNLSSYFSAWRIELTNSAKNEVKSLPVWLPSPDFPKQYVK